MTVIALIVVGGSAALSLVVAWWSARVAATGDVRTPQKLPTSEGFVEQVARDHDLGAVKVEDADVDGYIAARQTIQFAPGQRKSRMLSAVAVAAHESAHMLQHATGYRPWQVWWVLSAPALLCSWLAAVLAVLAAVIGTDLLAVISLGIFAIPLIAGALSAVVERDAVRRANQLIIEQSIVDPEAQRLARIVRSAARTYVVETVFDLGFLLRRYGWDSPPQGPGSGRRRRRRGAAGSAAVTAGVFAAGYGGGDSSGGGSGSGGGGDSGGGGGAW